MSTVAVLNALSDALLVVVCGLLIHRHRSRWPGAVVALGLIALAASLGVLRFSGVDALVGPHKFASLLSACAALPLLAYALRWPDDPIIGHWAGAGSFVLIVGGLGVAAVSLGLKLAGVVLPALAGLALLWTALQAREPGRLGRTLGAVLLLASFAVAAPGALETPVIGIVNRLQLLHLLMAAALLLMLWRRPAPASMPAPAAAA